MEIMGPNGANRSKQVYFRKVINRLRKAGVDSASNGDEVEISDVGRFLSYLSGLPAVRTDRVNALRRQIERDEYDVDSRIEEIVDDILEDLGVPPARV